MCTTATTSTSVPGDERSTYNAIDFELVLVGPVLHGAMIPTADELGLLHGTYAYFGLLQHLAMRFRGVLACGQSTAEARIGR